MKAATTLSRISLVIPGMFVNSDVLAMTLVSLRDVGWIPAKATFTLPGGYARPGLVGKIQPTPAVPSLTGLHLRFQVVPERTLRVGRRGEIRLPVVGKATHIDPQVDASR